MILVFGGTTEGRMAIEVCEQSESKYFYSTKGDSQRVELKYGVRMAGALSADEIRTFCENNDIQCIVDAAHPFAEALHESIAQVGLPVIRLERSFCPHLDGVTYCQSYDDAVQKMHSDGVKKLLALTGTNTISKLKDFWKDHESYFRILDRKESIDKAVESGFDEKHLIFFNDELQIPTLEEELELMHDIGCDAVITKESGVSGGCDVKVEAALQLGIKTYVIEHPQLPSDWIYVGGKMGLRKAVEKTVPDFFNLKIGFTTGSCATAATKAALLSLLSDDEINSVDFELPDGEIVPFEVNVIEKGFACAIKNFSDDPDVTKGCRIFSKVEFTDDSDIHFLQGEGVGIVTLPGLGIPVGGPAINQTPRAMITNEIRKLTDCGCNVTISVENGADLAEKTFNNKVGVVGGISILGSSGVVFPFSNEAFIRSLKRELEVAKAIGCNEIGLVSGKMGERVLTSEMNLRCIHYGNLVGEALASAKELGFEKVVLGIMIGKAVKLAEGNMDTHSHKVQMNKEFLKSIAGDDAYKIDNINMARDLWGCMPDAFFDKIRELCHKHCRVVYDSGELEIRLICDNQQ